MARRFAKFPIYSPAARDTNGSVATDVIDECS